MREAWRALMVLVTNCACVGGTHAQFADQVAPSWYAPAPGQFVNDPNFNDVTRALGAPVGAGLSGADNTSVVSLGGFGGSLILGFSQRVMDDPCNPMGLDAIVFGNAFYTSGNPLRRWAEPGTIEISTDDNHNGIPDDTWFVIRFPTLPGVPNDAHTSVAWDDNTTTPIPPANTAWFPSGVTTGAYITEGFLLGASFTVLVLENSDALREDFSGLVDMTPTLALGDTDADGVVETPSADPAEFYTVPDNPHTVGIDPGSAGGDAFDIAWAVDPATGSPANLDGFDFIRLRTGTDFIAAIFGESSTEIDAVSDVRAHPDRFDQDQNASVDLEDLYAWSTDPSDIDGDTFITPRDGALLRKCVRNLQEEGDR